MPRIYKSARGDTVDFDAVMIKQQLANAPMNIEVARRKEFIDNKEEKPRRTAAPALAPEAVVDAAAPLTEAVTLAQAPAKADDFEVEAPPPGAPKSSDGPVPNLPKR